MLATVASFGYPASARRNVQGGLLDNQFTASCWLGPAPMASQDVHALVREALQNLAYVLTERANNGHIWPYMAI